MFSSLPTFLFSSVQDNALFLTCSGTWWAILQINHDQIPQHFYFKKTWEHTSAGLYHCPLDTLFICYPHPHNHFPFLPCKPAKMWRLNTPPSMKQIKAKSWLHLTWFDLSGTLFNWYENPMVTSHFDSPRDALVTRIFVTRVYIHSNGNCDFIHSRVDNHHKACQNVC